MRPGLANMRVDKKQDGAKLVLAVEGRLDTNTAPLLDAELSYDGVDEVVFDLSGLEYLSSAGLRVLIGARKAMSAKGGSMSVANPNATVMAVFDITGCSGIFTITTT